MMKKILLICFTVFSYAIDSISQTFTVQSSIPLTGVKDSPVSWGDYDNNGDLDVLLYGVAGTYPNNHNVNSLYRNDNGVFSYIGAILTGVQSTSNLLIN